MHKTKNDFYLCEKIHIQFLKYGGFANSSVVSSSEPLIYFINSFSVSWLDILFWSNRKIF